LVLPTHALPRATLLPYTALFRSVAVCPSGERRHLNPRTRWSPPCARDLLGQHTQSRGQRCARRDWREFESIYDALAAYPNAASRSEEHTSELQSRGQLVCRLLLE